MLKHIFTVKIASYSFTGMKINTDSNAGCVLYVLTGTTREKLVVPNSFHCWCSFVNSLSWEYFFYILQQIIHCFDKVCTVSALKCIYFKTTSD